MKGRGGRRYNKKPESHQALGEKNRLRGIGVLQLFDEYDRQTAQHRACKRKCFPEPEAQRDSAFSC